MSGNQIKRVLVVDDDLTQVKLVEALLESEGYEVTSSTQADEGLKMALGQKPDLIILDVMMPVINGFNFCHLIKNKADCEHIQIVLVTSRSEIDDIKIGMNSGADAYLCKPIKSESLLKAINNLQQQ